MSTTTASPDTQVTMLGVLLAGLLLMWMILSSRWVERRMNRAIAWALKRFTDLDVRDYVALLELSRGFAITEMLVESGDWLEGKTLADLRLSDEGIPVLSIRPHGGGLRSAAGRRYRSGKRHLILYGELENIRLLDRRKAGQRGDWEHERAVLEQDEYERQQRADDPEVTGNSESGDRKPGVTGTGVTEWNPE